MTLRTYTLEIRNAWYNTGLDVRVHPGSFLCNRNLLSPGMIKTKEIRARNISLAKMEARQWFENYRREK